MSKNNESNWIYVDPDTVSLAKIVVPIAVALILAITIGLIVLTFFYIQVLPFIIVMILLLLALRGTKKDNLGIYGKCIIEDDTISVVHMEKTITKLSVDSIDVVRVLSVERPMGRVKMLWPYLFLCSGEHKTEELKELMKIPADVIRLAYTEETVAFVKKYFPDVLFEDEEGIIAKQEEKIQKQKQKQEQKRKHK